MFVSIDMVYQELSRSFQCIMHKKPDYELILNSTEFITEIKNPQSSVIYICDLHNFEEKGDRPNYDLLITIGVPAESLAHRCRGLLELPWGTSPLAVINSVNRLLCKWNQWERSLNEVVLHSGSINNLLEISAAVFGNPIGIHDSTLECVAETKYADPKQEQMSLRRRRNPDYLKSILEDPDIVQTFNRKQAFFTDSHSEKGRTLVKNLFIDDKFAFRIVITERAKTLGPQDAALLEYVSGYINALLVNGTAEQTDSWVTLPSLLEKILDGSISDVQDVSKHLQHRRWLPNDYYLCIVFEQSNIDIFDSTGKAISKRLRELSPQSEVLIYEKKLVVLADVGPSRIDIDCITRPFLEFMRDMNMRCGVSNLLQGYQQLRSQYLQAVCALRIGGKIREYFWIFHFNEFAPYYVMEQCVQELPAEAVCASEIVELYKYDAEHGTNYFQTLKEYLDCSMNLAAASKQLFVHRTTLLYRLSKIETLFKIKLDVPIRRVYYHLSLQILAHTVSFEETLQE